jgi:transposase
MACQTVSLVLADDDRARLKAIVADRSRPFKHVQRAEIILASDREPQVQRIAQSVGCSRPAVWRWQQRFAEEGTTGLLRDKSRKPGKPPTPPDLEAKVVEMTCQPPPHEATHWTGRAMAKAVGLSLRTVQRIWERWDLKPHRLRTFKRSKDPDFISKLNDIVGLYMDPPENAIVLSIDEKSQIQALDRTQPGLPLKPGKAATMTHDYKRHGTTTLFAALEIATGRVISQNMQRHRHEEFIRFLNKVNRSVPKDKEVHVVLDNYATHKHPKVLAWLARHPNWTFHFTPTGASWLNAVETVFSSLTRSRIRRGVFQCLMALQSALNRWIDELNQNPKPFVWTKSADKILQKVDRCQRASSV